MIMEKAAEITIKESAKMIKNLIEGWTYFLSHEVVVGITEDTAGRSGEVNNAELLYLHTNGVPSRNIPPRPVLEPALAQDEVKNQVKTLMRDAAVSALVMGQMDNCEKNFEKAGMIGRDACKKYISEGGHLAPNAPSTMARKLAKGKGKGDPKPLIDTGAMLNSITYAVRKK